ncbi:MAG: ABC transporter ATP-binding protein [Hyphomicrobiales bacterium]|nr:ABC transporter ATP-binding protein [Hyphomicrobiales bacterium]
MNDIVIRAEKLSKKYVIGHQKPGGYTALRDVAAGAARNLARSVRDIARGRPIVAGDEIEDFWALRDVDFEIRRGDTVAIVGRNGAGKSTLLKILSRITEPSAGCVVLNGRAASLLEVGTGFHPELTGRENIYLNGAILGMSRAEIRCKFDEIVDFAGVEKFLDTPVKRYSSGMYVRLAFSVAAHLEPEILIVDEVLAVGDAEFQKKCLGKMSDVAGSGRTVLFVSHNLAAAAALCKRGFLLADGRLVASGDIASIISRYAQGGEQQARLEFRPRADAPSMASITIDSAALAQGDLIVDIAYTAPFPIAAIGGIALQTSAGARAYTSNCWMHEYDNPLEAQAGVLRCAIHGLPIIPDRYQLSVWLCDRHVVYETKVDCMTVEFPDAHMRQHLRGAIETGCIDWPARWQGRTVDVAAAAHE